MAPFDKPYSWPDSTCLHPAMALYEYINGSPLPNNAIFDLPEAKASQLVKRRYNNSWLEYIADYLERNGGGRRVATEKLECGDVVEFDCDRIKVCGRVWTCNPVGIVADTQTLFMRGQSGVHPIPRAITHPIMAVRLEKI